MKTQLMSITDETGWLEKRGKYLTSTQSASLFGLQMPSAPTAFELWYIKRGNIEEENKPNPRMVWGKRLEQTIAQGIAQDFGLRLMPMRVFAHDDDDMMGSSFDNVVECPSRGLALLEVKTVAYRDYKEKFIEDDNSDFIEAPAYYEIQAQHELEVLDQYDHICIAVFIMDTREVKMLWRERDREMGAAIRRKVREFWASTEPPPPDLKADADLLARMHRANSSDSAFDATKHEDFDIWAMSYIQESQKEKAAKEEKDTLKSRMILAMGSNNSAWCNVARVSNKSKFTVTETKKGK